MDFFLFQKLPNILTIGSNRVRTQVYLKILEVYMNIYEIRKALMSGKTIYDLPLRVTYYARVSTEKEQQKNSLENQDMYYKNKILSNPKWTFVQGYTDDGITGTSTKKRNDFNDMIFDGQNDKYDLILTKEVCRFARNTLDTLQITRDLLARGKGVYFELDNINTLDQEGELRLTIMASLAQDESRRLSERTKFGFNRSIERGRVLGNNVIWGYEKNNCTLVINENEAKIVKRAYELYATGNIGIRGVSKQLAQEGMMSRSGTPLSYSTLKGILENPKYKGFYCGKKTEVIDFLTKERVELPKEEWVNYKTTEDIVPQIVDEELWEKCNEIRKKRHNRYTSEGTGWTNRYMYSNLLICSHDGKLYWRRKYRPTSPEEYWGCSEYLRSGNKGCITNTYLTTNELNQILKDVFDEMIENKNKIIKNMINVNNEILKKNRKASVDCSIIEKQIEELEESKKNLVKLYSLNKIDESEFDELNAEYKNNIVELKSKLIDIQNDRLGQEIEKNNQRIKDYFKFDNFEITQEFVHNKISNIKVTQIDKNHIGLKIKFHFDLELSEVDKKSICFGLSMCILGAFAFNLTPYLEPCFTISGSSKINSSADGVTIP